MTLNADAADFIFIQIQLKHPYLWNVLNCFDLILAEIGYLLRIRLNLIYLLVRIRELQGYLSKSQCFKSHFEKHLKFV